MKEIQYKTFSWRTHKKNWQLKKPNVCQFELTFACDLHCRYCYSDCYNKPSFIKKELNTKQVRFILDKVHQAGVIWLCFTGGDPLKREDFLEIYAYAKDKGFIITIFTNGYSMSKDTADYLKKQPPFVIEMTLNAVSKDLYEKISQVKDSFKKVMNGINLILKAKLPLKIKTQITKDNLRELPRIKKFIKAKGLKFRASPVLYARLNGDIAPCNLRISPQEILGLNGKEQLSDHDCDLSPNPEPRTPNFNLFRCAAGGGDGFHIDPYGKMPLCNLIRKPKVNLLTQSIEEALNKLLPLASNSKFKTNSRCRYCGIRNLCLSCPGKALVEIKDMEAPVEWFCKLGHLMSGKEMNSGE